MPMQRLSDPQWRSGVDPASGHTYYHHMGTGVSQWERPADFVGDEGIPTMLCIETELGTIRMRLRPDAAPETVIYPPLCV